LPSEREFTIRKALGGSGGNRNISVVRTGSANLWLDIDPSGNGNGIGPLFHWSGKSFIDLGGDVYALGSGAANIGAGGASSLSVDSSTPFFVIIDTPTRSLSTATMTLGAIETAIATNCPNTVHAGVWIGLDIPAGTTGTGYMVIPPVSYPPKLQIVTT